MVNVPKTYWVFCKKCDKHQPHQVTQHKKVKDPLYAKESGMMTGNRMVMVIRLNLFSTKKLRLQRRLFYMLSPSAQSMLASMRCWHFDLRGDEKKK
ncbi:60S ribosomal protein L36a-like [Lemmus lemmus]